MTLDDGEVEIVLLALQEMSDKAGALGGLGGYTDIQVLGGVGKKCCAHIAAKCRGLITRIQQHQEDRKNGDA